MLTTNSLSGVSRSGLNEDTDMKMIEIKITRATVANGKDVLPGDVFETSEADAKFLCNIGKAVLAADADKTANVEQVIGAISALDMDNKEHFTTDGKPKVDAIEELLGMEVSGEMRDQAWAEFEA